MLEEDSPAKEAVEWASEPIDVLILLGRYSKIMTNSKKCSKTIYSELITTINLVTEYY